MTARYLPLEARPPYARPCRPCAGRGVTGEQYQLPAGATGDLLIADVICPACGGCGNGDPTHQDCPPLAHADSRDDEDLDLDDDVGDEAAERCYSCGSSRGWYPVQGFTDGGEQMYTLRMPCGCSASRLVEARP